MAIVGDGRFVWHVVLVDEHEGPEVLRQSEVWDDVYGRLGLNPTLAESRSPRQWGMQLNKKQK